MYSTKIITLLFNWVEIISQKEYYPYYLGMVLMVISWFLVAPHFLFLETSSVGWQTIILKSNDLTNSLNHLNPGDNNAKKVFRLTVPFLMKVANLCPLAVIIIQCSLGYFLYIVCYKLSFRILKDAVSATLITAGIAFIHFGRVAYFDINFTWFDAFAYFFLMMALYSRTFVGILLFSTLAAWTDERAFIALSIVFIYHQFNKINFLKVKFKQFFRFNNESIAVLISIVLYLVIRGILTYTYGMSTPSDDLGRLGKTMPYMPLGIWTYLEGFWLIYSVALIHSFRTSNHFLFFLLLLPITVLIIVSAYVSDITRSGSYIVPILFFSIIYLKNVLEKDEFRVMLFISFAVCLFYPATIVCADWDLHMWFPQSSFYYVGGKSLELLNIYFYQLYY